VDPAVPLPIAQEGLLRVASEDFSDKNRFPDVPSTVDGKIVPWNFIAWAQSKGDIKFANSIGNSHFPADATILHVDTFYHRLQGNVIYFTETAADPVVIAALKITGVKDSSELGIPGCFEVMDKMDTWSLCEETAGDADTWVCKVKESLGLTCEAEEPTPVVKKNKVLQPVMIVPLPSPDCATDWNYDQHGADWVCRCNEGLEQSPIDLPFG